MRAKVSYLEWCKGFSSLRSLNPHTLVAKA